VEALDRLEHQETAQRQQRASRPSSPVTARAGGAQELPERMVRAGMAALVERAETAAVQPGWLFSSPPP